MRSVFYSKMETVHPLIHYDGLYQNLSNCQITLEL